MALRQHADAVFGWSRFQPERGYDFNGTALVADDGVLLVDPVPATDEEHAAISRLGSAFTIVVLNSDHERDAAAFQQRYHAPVFVPRADLGTMKLLDVQPFDHRHVFAGGWVAHTLPGMKTPGESILHHPKRRMVVVGDAIIADPSTGLRLVPPAKLPDRDAALRSLARLLNLDFDGLLPGDGFILPSGGREALRKFVTSASTRT